MTDTQRKYLTVAEETPTHKLPVISREKGCRPEACVGCPFGGQTTGTRGPEDSPFVIVGESPGSNELYQGYPFVGESGVLLKDTLEACGLLPTDPAPYFIHAVQCFPRNKEPKIMQTATAVCSGRLHKLIKAHPRKLIIALGASAAQALTNNPSLRITQERGKRYHYEGSQLGTIVTLHPAYLMRQGTMYGPWKRDINYAVALLQGRDPKEGQWREPKWSVVDGREALQTLLEDYRHASHIGADIETGGRDENGFPSGLHFQKGHIINLGVTKDGRHIDIIEAKTIWENEDLMQELLGLPAKWIWQNGKFDVKFFRYEGLTNARVDEDTMLLSYALNENKGHDLDTIAWDWIGAPKHKHAIEDWFKSKGIARKNWDYAMVPRMEVLYPYAALDISKMFDMFFLLREAVNMDKHTKMLYEETLIPASEFLTGVEMKGMQLDPERIKENDAYLLGQIELVEADIQKYAIQYMGHPINIGSWQQLQVLLYNKLKLGPIGSPTDEDALIKAQRRFDHPIIPRLMKWRTLSKARNTYVKSALGTATKPAWTGPDGRVHITFKIHGTSTGRLSSGDPTNLQNWPRDPQIRGAFVAAPNHTLVEQDLNQAELRCLAIMSGDPTLVEIYVRNEVSIHHVTSVAMFGEGYDDDQKMRAKAVNFGIVYGRTAPSLAEEFNISLKEAEDYIRIWLERFPVARDFIQDCRDAPTQMRNLVTNFGRKKRWGVISEQNQRNSENESANFPHQSTAHDITLRAGIECQPVVKAIWDIDFVNEIHDALYTEPLDDINVYGPATAYVTSVMQRIPRDYGLGIKTGVPFIAEAKQGTRWGRSYMHGFDVTDDHRAEAERLVSNHLGRKVDLFAHVSSGH